MRLGADEKPPRRTSRSIPTGSLALDIALGVGGLPARPRHRDLRAGVVRQDDADPARHRRGAEARRHRAPSSTPSTRSTSATRASSACAPTTCSSRSRTPASRRSRSPTCWCARGAIDVIVVDSVAALVPQGRDRRRDGRRAHGPAGAPDEPGAAQAHRHHLRSRRRCVIFINQIRMKIGVMFGNPETTTGGNALKFYARCASTSAASAPSRTARTVDRQPHRA